LLYWLTSFRGEDFKTFFPIGSYVKTTVCLLKVAILDGGRGHRTHFESILPKDHPCHVCFKLADWFQKRRLLNNFHIANMSSMVLRWSTSKIVFSDPDLGSKWLPSADIVLT
jgi:hypothetical protein